MQALDISAHPVTSPWALRRLVSDDVYDFFETHGARTVVPYGYGKVAFRDALRLVGARRGTNVLLPAYFPHGAVEAVRALGVEPRFYRVTKELGADVADAESRIDDDTVALVWVNYFGFPQRDRDALLELADRYDLATVDDNAHGAFSTDDGRLLGTFGDVGFTSIHKVLDVPNGGALFVDDDRPRLRPAAPAGVALRYERSDLRFCLGAALRTLGQRRPWLVKALAGGEEASSGPPDSSVLYETAQSRMSRLTERTLACTDPRDVVAARRRAYAAWETHLAGDGCVADARSPFESLPTGVCPWMYPALVDDVDRFKATYANVGGVYTWPTLPGEVAFDAEYPTANWLTDHLVTLPVHQSIPAAMLGLLTEAGAAAERGLPVLPESLQSTPSPSD